MLGSTSRSKRLSRRREMGFRFWRRVRIIPGMRVNLSKRGVSASIGKRGLWLTVGPRGPARLTIGAPGTGLFWWTRLPPHATPSEALPLLPPALRAAPRHARQRWALAILVAVVAIAVFVWVAFL
jgi:hypothetical protein